ncbi:MAG: helix-turn-helix domain-containing protein [Lachnospiraceae bacterium]|nr:helix-turn-helix domain-containing protein [Lachnospiraceae bacterium]
MHEVIKMNTIAERIRKGMELRNLKQTDLVEKTGISKGALSSYISGRYEPKQNNIYLIAKALSVNEAWLMGVDVPMEKQEVINHKKGITINVLGRVAAGIPIEAVENIIDTEEISEDMARTGEFFGLQIHGDSMEPRMYEGDIVIVRQQDDAETGDIVIALVNGNDATCKRLTKYSGGIALTSLNSKYDPIMFSNEEIISKPVKIIGKVVELRGKL